MSPGKRNELRRFYAATLDRFALAIGAAGLFKPVFEPGPDDTWLVLSALLIAVAAALGAAYLLVTLEDE